MGGEESDAELAELTGYLRFLRAQVDELLVVDASDAGVYERNERAWGDLATHVRPDPRHRFAMPKVDGVTTGVLIAANERVIVADDDVRYGTESLARTVALLDEADLVRPQNYFAPLRWHARWDTARTLLNRAWGADYPGTLAIRRSRFESIGGYDGNVMFENLELIRTVRAAGGHELAPLDLYVRRLPPTTRHFVSQRVRQAYDDLAQPARMVAFLGLLPIGIASIATRRWAPPAGAALASMLVAEAGRRRAGGTRVFPPSATLLAPAWVCERALCIWLALGARVLRGGIGYRGMRIRAAATPERVLRRRLAQRPAGPPLGA